MCINDVDRGNLYLYSSHYVYYLRYWCVVISVSAGKTWYAVSSSQVHRQKVESDTIPFMLSASERYGIEKVRISLCLMKLHTIQAYGGSDGINSRILNLGIRFR